MDGLEGMQGMVIACVRLFFSFVCGGTRYSCALIEWFIPESESDNDTGMWVVRPEFQSNGDGL